MWKTCLLRFRVLASSLLACRQHGCKLNLPDGMYLSVVSFMDLNTFRWYEKSAKQRCKL